MDYDPDPRDMMNTSTMTSRSISDQSVTSFVISTSDDAITHKILDPTLKQASPIDLYVYDGSFVCHISMVSEQLICVNGQH